MFSVENYNEMNSEKKNFKKFQKKFSIAYTV